VSPLEQALTDYLRLRHSLGHELAEAAWLLPGFVAYLDAHGCPTVTVEAALVWAQQTPKSPTGRASTVGPRRMTAVRGFARYLSGIDASTQVPPLGLMPHRARWRRPFIYSATDIDAVLNQARQSIGSPLRAATYETLIGLLAASGLRIGEAIKLDRTDVDWDQGVLLIRESKFGKSRLVPCTRAAWRLLSVTPSCIPARWREASSCPSNAHGCSMPSCSRRSASSSPPPGSAPTHPRHLDCTICGIPSQ